MVGRMNKEKWKIARKLHRRSKKETIPLEEWLQYELKIIKMVSRIKNKENKCKMKK